MKYVRETVPRLCKNRLILLLSGQKKLNREKSKEIIRNTIPNIKFYGIDVEQVDHAKRLGITISHDLSWNKHV